ncbi:hypothetical protein [Streptomyces sp. NPDC048710]|uniref:hypothetical protein n=1 Tax=Streptomyces sp. NPDC048710 TaxID=3365586 RepID=UPI003720B6A4
MDALLHFSEYVRVSSGGVAPIGFVGLVAGVIERRRHDPPLETGRLRRTRLTVTAPRRDLSDNIDCLDKIFCR